MRGLAVRRVDYRRAPDGDLALIHRVESEVDAVRRAPRKVSPIENFIAEARAFPAQFTEWSWLVQDASGEPVATGACWYQAGEDPNTITTDTWVRAPWRRRGIGSHLLSLACSVAHEEGRGLLVAWTTDKDPSGESFARRFGMEPGMVNRQSELVLDDVDWDMVHRWVEQGPQRAPAYGLELVEGPYPAHLLADAVTLHDIMQTAPRDDFDVEDTHTNTDEVAQWDKWLVDSGRTRWAIFARHKDTRACVGGTNVTFEPWQPDYVQQGDTGVHPDHRGHALGKWLKAAMLEKVRAERPEAQRVRTGNAFSNAPMLGINDALGFKVTRTSIDWQAKVVDVAARLGLL